MKMIFFLVLIPVGYSALHMAAAWNRVESLKVLIDSGVDCELKNIYNEVARDVAARYKNHICVNYLDGAGVQCILLALAC